MHALIIEQDLWIILMIEDVLNDLGYSSVASAASPEQAIDAVSRQCPDLITSAMRFGTEKGIQAVREICAARDIPVVFVTSTPWEVREVDPDAIIVAKPFGENMLKAGVARATGAA
jgi:CheY-like chemotaxis protein